MRLVVTRPADDAARSARRLARLGHDCLVAPLTNLRPRAFAWPDEPPDALVVTSANALAALPTAVPDLAMPLFAVGERTGRAARTFGFSDVRVGGGDARALLDTIAGSLPLPSRLLYLAGADRKPTLEVELAAHGFKLTVRETYEMAPLVALPDRLTSALTAGRLDAALHYSRRSAGIFCRLATEAGLRAQAGAIAHHCLSSDIASPLRTFGATRLIVAEGPREAALFATLSP